MVEKNIKDDCYFLVISMYGCGNSSVFFSYSLFYFIIHSSQIYVKEVKEVCGKLRKISKLSYLFQSNLKMIYFILNLFESRIIYI